MKSVKNRFALTQAVVEALEDRRLLYGDITTVQPLPYDLFFNTNNGGIVDGGGIGTGFTFVQPNKNTNAAASFFPEYNPTLISVPQNPDGSYQGVLNLTTTGNSTNGGPFEGDNTLVNSLQTTFDASTGSWTVTVRLQGPLSNLAASSEQGGLMFGPDDDNYIKLVAAAQPAPNNQVLQFIDETKTGSTYSHSVTNAGSFTNIGSFANINTLDLRISGDPLSGTVIGFFRINGGSFVKLAQQFTYSGALASMFFSPAAHTGLIAMAKNDLPPVTVGFNSFMIEPGTPTSQRPSVTAISPANGAAGVFRDTAIIASIALPTAGAGIDSNTLTSASVQLRRVSDGSLIATQLTTDGAGGVINLHPTQALDPNTQFQVSVNAGLLDTNGASFLPFSSIFTTGSSVKNPTPTAIAFQDVDLATATGQQYTCVMFGPDGLLYASTLTGLIQRFSVNADGSLGSPQTITTMQTNNGNTNREVTGFTFDPASTASNLMMWVSSSQYAVYGAADWTGKISLLTGPNLENYQDYVIGLPRSIKDHQVEKPTFGPDGAMYVAVASNTAMGAPDNAWGLRPEDLLSASILRVDTAGIKTNFINQNLGALNVQTGDLPAGASPYNPYAPAAPVTLYATGVRNAYDIIWNGNTLYASTNGSAANGNVPSTPAGYFESVAGFTDPVIEPDMLYKITPGGYYGHPDPARGEYILDGGNPTGAATYTLSNGATAIGVLGYPVGTQPDPNYRGTIDTLGLDNSADGTLIYHGNAFNGLINNALVIAQYSVSQDISILKLDGNGNVAQTITGVAGLENLNSPLSVTQFANGSSPLDPRNGYMYVSEYGAEKLELLVPVTPGAKISVDKPTVYFSQPRGTTGAPQTITISNTGTSTLSFPSVALTLGGANNSSFAITNAPTFPVNVAPGASITIGIAFKPGSTSATGIQTATFSVASNDPNTPLLTINLRGLATTGYGGANEPSGQNIFNLFQIPDNTGTPDPSNNFMPYPPGSPDDELQIKQFVKAGAGPVTLQPLAVYSVTNGIRVGYYNSGDPSSKSQIFTLSGPNALVQTVTPNVVGSTSFDPGTGDFSMYTEFPGFTNADKATDRDSYQEDVLNTWDPTVADRQKVRIYPLKNSDGSIVPNAYIFIPEDFTTADDNDAVIIIRNVTPAPSSPVFGFVNPDEDPNSDVLAFARQQNPQLPILPPATALKTPQTPHDTVTLQLLNTGNQPEIISNITLTAPLTGPIVNGSRTSAYSITNLPVLPLTIPAGSSVGLTIQFVSEGYISNGAFANSVRGQVSGSLSLTTNDPNHPTKTFTLNGFWQIYPETTASGQYDEFPVATTLAGMGYTTVIGTGQNTGGAATAVGQEILSSYWNLADPTQVVTVHQLQAYHTAGNTATLGWYLQNATTNHNFLTAAGSDAETVYPRTTATGNPPGIATFNPASATSFGFVIDNAEHSDDALNSIPAGSTTDVGHHMRFYPAIDEHGQYIPNTFIMIMDYSGINYDYNDNAYLISNIRPATSVAAPLNVAGSTDFNTGNTITWSGNTESIVTGYNVYRSTSQSSGFTLLNPTPLSTPRYLDVTAVVGTRYYYRITALSTGAPAESFPSEITLTRAATSSGTGGGLTINGSFDFPAATAGGIQTITQSAIHITSAGNAKIDTAANHANRTLLVTGALQFDGSPNAWQGKLDITSNDLIVHNASLTNIQNQLQEGYNGITGFWTGNAGITSSVATANPAFLTTVGYRAGGVPFDGVTTTASDVLVKYTYFGDADLNGKVDGADYQQIDNGFDLHLAGWFNGDFNYDGIINGSDFALIDNEFNQQSTALVVAATLAAKSPAPVNAQPTAGAQTPFSTSQSITAAGAITASSAADILDDANQKHHSQSPFVK